MGTEAGGYWPGHRLPQVCTSCLPLLVRRDVVGRKAGSFWKFLGCQGAALSAWSLEQFLTTEAESWEERVCRSCCRGDLHRNLGVSPPCPGRPCQSLAAKLGPLTSPPTPGARPPLPGSDESCCFPQHLSPPPPFSSHTPPQCQ